VCRSVCPPGLVLLLAVVLGCGNLSIPSSPGNQGGTGTTPAAAPRTEPAADRPSPPREETTAPHSSPTQGGLQVTGDTDDWFTVHQNGKQAGPSTPPKLNSVIELAPGAYEVSVNKTKRTVTIEAGKKTIVATGTLIVEGKGDWWTPHQGGEAKLVNAPPTLNSPLALFPGTYAVTVHVGQKDEKLTDDARVVAGEKTVLKR
jgi:hypothetical protein